MATYIDQLELARLFIEKFTSEKQDQQLREYLGNLKDAIIVFRRPVLEEGNAHSKARADVSELTDRLGEEVLFQNQLVGTIFGLNF